MTYHSVTALGHRQKLCWMKSYICLLPSVSGYQWFRVTFITTISPFDMTVQISRNLAALWVLNPPRAGVMVWSPALVNFSNSSVHYPDVIEALPPSLMWNHTKWVPGNVSAIVRRGWVVLKRPHHDVRPFFLTKQPAKSLFMKISKCWKTYVILRDQRKNVVKTQTKKSWAKMLLVSHDHFPRYWPFLGGGGPPVTGEFPLQRPVTRGFDVFFYLCQNGRLCKQSRRR